MELTTVEIKDQMSKEVMLHVENLQISQDCKETIREQISLEFMDSKTVEFLN